MGTRLRKIRKALGFTQEKFGRLLNITRVAYGAAERGETSLAMKHYATLRCLYGNDLNYLIVGDGNTSDVVGLDIGRSSLEVDRDYLDAQFIAVKHLSQQIIEMLSH